MLARAGANEKKNVLAKSHKAAQNTATRQKIPTESHKGTGNNLKTTINTELQTSIRTYHDINWWQVMSEFWSSLDYVPNAK